MKDAFALVVTSILFLACTDLVMTQGKLEDNPVSSLPADDGRITITGIAVGADGNVLAETELQVTRVHEKDGEIFTRYETDDKGVIKNDPELNLRTDLNGAFTVECPRAFFEKSKMFTVEEPGFGSLSAQRKRAAHCEGKLAVFVLATEPDVEVGKYATMVSVPFDQEAPKTDLGRLTFK